MPLDLTKPLELLKAVTIRSNYYSPGSYRPGELPEEVTNEEYCRNVGTAPAPVGDALPDPAIPVGSPQTPPPPIVKAIESEKINLNKADITTIVKVEGIGTATANKIVTERDTNGDFKDLNDLLARVKGITNLTNTIEQNFIF